MPLTPGRELETFENANPDLFYEIVMECPEFTCLCPLTGQPDHATITVTFIPADLCLELKSFKQYLWSFRDVGIFHEDVTNQILNDLVAALSPHHLEIVGDFNVRGGIHTTVRTSYTREDDE